MEAYMEWIWMGLLIFFGIVEAATVSLTSLWFVGGALPRPYIFCHSETP